MLTRPLLRLESLENEIKSLKDALVLLRGYFHGTKLEKRTAVASVAMREAVKHWYVVFCVCVCVCAVKSLSLSLSLSFIFITHSDTHTHTQE